MSKAVIKTISGGTFDVRMRQKKASTTRPKKIQSNVDRFFTKRNVLEAIAKKCKPLITNGTTFVDFSCGTNEFALMLECPFISYDLNKAPNAKQKDWFKVKTAPTNAIIGLNPPFGYQSHLARKFIQHATSFSPQYIVLIIPKTKWVPEGYQIKTQEKLPCNAFYLPDTNEEFSYPTWFYILERSKEVKSKSTTNDVIAPKGVRVLQQVETVDKSVSRMLVLRRIGYYAGRQAYTVYKDNVQYHFKDTVTSNVSWTTNQHSIKNSFFVIYFDRPITKKELYQLPSFFIEQMDQKATQTRKEDQLRPPHLTKKEVHIILNNFFSKQ